MKTKFQQRGASFLFWVIFIAIFSFFLVLGVKLFPVYYKGITTNDVLGSVAVEMTGKKPNKKQIWDSVSKRLNINSVMDIKKEHFFYAKNKKDIEFGLDYETRVPVIGNLDVVAKFNQRQTINIK